MTTTATDVELKQLARERAFSALDDAWERAAEGAAETGIRPFLEAAKVLADQNESDRAAVLLALLGQHLQKAGKAKERLEVLRRAAELSSRPDEQRADLLDAIEAVYGERPGFDAYVRRSGLRDAKAPVPPALRTLFAELDFPIGRHLRHGGSWGVGRVVDVDARTGDVIVDFENKKGHRFPVDSAIKFCERLPDDCLLARAFSDLEGLRKLATEDPGELVRLAVRSRGGESKSDEIKKDLTDKVIGQADWAKVWANAKKSLTHDPLVQLTAGARPTVKLRVAEIRFADDIAAEIRGTSKLEAAFGAAQRFLREIERSPGEITDAERARVADLFAQKLRATAEKEVAAHPGLVISAQFLLDDLLGTAGEPAHPAIGAIRTDASRFLEVARDIADVATLKRYAALLEAADAKAYLATLEASFPEASKDIYSHITATLKAAAPDALGRAIARVVSSPEPEIDTIFDIARDSFAGKLDLLPGAPGSLRVFERLVAFADKIERQRAGGAKDRPNLRPRMKQLLGAKGHAIVRKYFEEAEATVIPHTYRRVTESSAISDEVREAARSVVARKHPSVLTGGTKVRYFWEEEGTLFMSRKGLRALDGELDEVRHKKLPAIFEAIGAAAALGDLSENAEYTAALEEREKLVARAERLQEEVKRARVLEDVAIRDDVCGPGTKVRLVGLETGKEETYTILGPWDADLERGIISYTAPLARGLLGRSVDEEATVTLPGGGVKKLRVVAIERAV